MASNSTTRKAGDTATSEKADTAAPASEKADESDETKSGTAYLNTTTGLIVYDREGHGVAGGEWTPPVNLDAIGQAARRNGYLLPRSAL